MINIDIFQLIIKPLWPLWLTVAAILLLIIIIDTIIPYYLKKRRNRINFDRGNQWREDNDFIRWLRGMRPDEFEEYVAELFRRLGYKSEKVGMSHDGGIDVRIEKDGDVGYIQCKKFINRPVPVGAVRDFYGALASHFSKSKGYFITTNTFTLEAIKFAEDKPIELIDQFKLIKYIKLVESVKSNQF
ncbi:MAG: restriction endonuclease [Candidatus Paceibacterota bacterium]